MDLWIQPYGLAADSAGNVYFGSLTVVFKMDRNGIATRVAGNARQGYSGDGGPATEAQLSNVEALAIDGSGNLFIGDGSRVRKVSASGIITTVAGGSIPCNTDGPPIFCPGDGGPAVDAQLDPVTSLAVDGEGNLFLGSYDARVREVGADGIIRAFAGTGKPGFSGDGGPAAAAQLTGPTALAVDRAGNLFIGDWNRLRKVDSNGIISTVAGEDSCNAGSLACLGDGGPATKAYLQVAGIAVDDAGNLFVGDEWNDRIRKISPGGIITTVAGIGFGLNVAFFGDGGPATAAQLTYVSAVSVDGAGNLFVSDESRIREISSDGIINTVAGNGVYLGFGGGFSGDGGLATGAELVGPTSVAVDDAGDLFFPVSDPDCGGFDSDQRVREVAANGTITTIAGNGTRGFSGDGGPAPSAELNNPVGVAIDRAGNLFIADTGNGRIRQVSPDGTIQTFAGNGSFGLSLPVGVAVDAAGNLFTVSGYYYGNSVSKVSPDGTITAVAGAGPSGFSGDGGPATNAQLSDPQGVAVDSAGNLFIADGGNDRVRKVTPDGTITTVAGTGKYGFSGDGGPAIDAQLGYPEGVAVDHAGNLFIADSNRIRVVSPDGTIATVAGTGNSGYSGDGGPAGVAQLNLPTGMTVDSAGNIFVADSFNHAVRVLRRANSTAFVRPLCEA